MFLKLCTFFRGAANIAARTHSDVRPVVISCEPLTLGKEEKWYQIPERRFHYHMKVDKSLDIDPYLQQSATIAARKLTHDLQSYFSLETNWNE